MQWAKVIEVFAIVLLPVAAGMIVRRLWPRFAKGMDKPVRIASIIILVVVIAGAVASELGAPRRELRAPRRSSRSCSASSASPSATSPRACSRSGKRQAIASSFEIGIHNATLAIVIAQTVLGSVELSLPAAVYGVLMFFIAFGFGFLIRDRKGADADDTACRRHRRRVRGARTRVLTERRIAGTPRRARPRAAASAFGESASRRSCAHPRQGS